MKNHWIISIYDQTGNYRKIVRNVWIKSKIKLREKYEEYWNF
jgi:hypothetical protein